MERKATAVSYVLFSVVSLNTNIHCTMMIVDSVCYSGSTSGNAKADGDTARGGTAPKTVGASSGRSMQSELQAMLAKRSGGGKILLLSNKCIRIYSNLFYNLISCCNDIEAC